MRAMQLVLCVHFKMKRLGKILLYCALAGALLLIAVISLTVGWRPFIGPKARPLTSRKFEATPQRLERGPYVSELAGCQGCHSQHDWNTHGAPVIPGTDGGGQWFDMPDLPGRVVAPNLTPDRETGAGTWTDDQLARAIREGIGHDGHALFPMMPYQGFDTMSDEDLASVVVYLRSLPPVHSQLEKTEIIFPVKYLIRSVPEPVTAPVASPDPADRVKYGQYLVTIGGCGDCHTPQKRGQPVAGFAYAGGLLMRGPWGDVSTANITPDASGISYYDEALFIEVMRTGYVKARKLNSIMPFGAFKNLTDDDLKAMFAYLRTVKPVQHRVDNTQPPTYCKLCRQKHGGGDQN
jgi:mono/diheme cytochrome c family protein